MLIVKTSKIKQKKTPHTKRKELIQITLECVLFVQYSQSKTKTLERLKFSRFVIGRAASALILKVFCIYGRTEQSMSEVTLLGARVLAANGSKCATEEVVRNPGYGFELEAST
jgi:hypothetical protein